MTAHMARRPCLISLSASSSVISNWSGFRPKSPGARSPVARPMVVATPEMSSMAVMKTMPAQIAFGCLRVWTSESSGRRVDGVEVQRADIAT